MPIFQNKLTFFVFVSYFAAVVFLGIVARSYADDTIPTVSISGATPVVASVVVSPDPITLTENTSTTITITASISDSDGCDDVFASGTISAVLYRSGVGVNCVADDNNCYRDITLSEVGNTCAGGADTDGDASGTVKVWYLAEATDANSSYPSENWIASVKAVDGSNGSSTATSSVELLSLVVASPVPPSSGGGGGGSISPGIGAIIEIIKKPLTILKKIFGFDEPIEIPASFVYGDFNEDGIMDVVDLSILLYHFENGDLKERLKYDLTSDGRLDFFDISHLFYYWT
ncbi:MAG: hypothetical protein HYT12_00305 [Candidatus Liptonbacteria bacterium]|nr:hypothetical protein [Candidatus Liptonbacteria bacterium]